MHRLLLLGLLLLPLPAQPSGPLLKVTPIDRAVDRSLEFLATTQNKGDGSWTAGRAGKSVAVTSLCVMAFLSAGHVPGEGKYGATIERGVRWVLSAQAPSGLLSSDGSHEMYHHGIATLMLAEVSGMLDRETGKEVRRAVEKAVAVILKAQRVEGSSRGGWRYRVEHIQGADISVTGWQIMALRAARNLGCDVPAEAIDNAVRYIKDCQDSRTGGFRYTPFAMVTVPCTGTSVLALELCGKREHKSDPVLRGAGYLIRTENLPRWGTSYFFYGIYYGAQASFQVGDSYWTAYRARLHEVLLRNQSASGAWMGGTEGNYYGGTYCSAMAVLSLTVEYRFLPIYQRGEEPGDARAPGGKDH